MVLNNMHRFYGPISRENFPNRIFGSTAWNASNVNIDTIVFSLALDLLSPLIGGSWRSQHNFKLPRWLRSLLLLRWHKLFRFGLRVILVHHRLSIIVISALVLAFALEVLLSLEILLHVLMHRWR